MIEERKEEEEDGNIILFEARTLWPVFLVLFFGVGIKAQYCAFMMTPNTALVAC